MTNTPKNSSAPSDARRRAEERVRYLLAKLDRWDAPYRPTTLNVDADDLRALLAEQEGDNRWRSRALDAEMALRVLVHQHRTGKPPDVERFADLAGRSNELLREAPAPHAPEAQQKGDDPWIACGCRNPDDCEHVFYQLAPDALAKPKTEVG